MRFHRAIQGVDWGLASVGAGICLLAMVLITVTSVFGRYVLQDDLIPGAYNIIERVLFPLLVFWALPLAHREGSFPRLEIVSDALSFPLRTVLAVFVLIVEIGVYGVVLWFVTLFVWTGIETGRSMQIGTDFWPLWPIIIMMPLALALMLVEMVQLLVADGRRLFGSSRGSQDQD